jgi:hypothetical protein
MPSFMLLGVIAKGSKVAMAAWETLVSVQRNRILNIFFAVNYE